MLSRVRDTNIRTVYLAAFLLGAAYGLAIALISLHLDERGFDKPTIGQLAAWFAAGIVALSIPAGHLVKRFGAKRTLVVALAGYAGCVALFPNLSSYAAIAAARFVDGACSVCIWVGFETILLQRSKHDEKAFVTSLYAMAIAIGYVVGPLAAKAIVAAAPMRVAFAASGVIALVAAAVSAFKLEGDPTLAAHEGAASHPPEDSTSSTPARALVWANKTSCFATFAYGYFQASVVLFLPLYLIEEKGIAKDQTILIPAFFAAGMLLMSNAAGRFGDRMGHLFVMRLLSIVGMTMILGFVFLKSFALMCAAVFVAGATLASISPVSLALQGLTTAPRDYGRANAIYNAFYASGILLGPPISSVFFARLGGAPMLLHLAAMWAVFIGFSLAFATDDPVERRRREGLGVRSVPLAPRSSGDLSDAT